MITSREGRIVIRRWCSLISQQCVSGRIQARQENVCFSMRQCLKHLQFSRLFSAENFSVPGYIPAFLTNWCWVLWFQLFLKRNECDFFPKLKIKKEVTSDTVGIISQEDLHVSTMRRHVSIKYHVWKCEYSRTDINMFSFARYSLGIS